MLETTWEGMQSKGRGDGYGHNQKKKQGRGFIAFSIQ